MPDEVQQSTQLTAPDDRRAQWLKDRQGCITATDVAKILGISKYGGPISVYEEKLGIAPQIEATEPMRRGLQLEPAILSIYDAEVAPLVREQPYTLLRSAQHPIIGATLDARRAKDSDDLSARLNPDLTVEGARFDGRPVDAKNVWRDSSEWGDIGTDQMPPYFGVQLMIQMLVTNTERADLAVLFSGNEFRHYTIHRNRETEANLIETCDSFWREHVEKRIPPEPDSTEAYKSYLSRAFARHTEVILRATAQHHEIASHLAAALEEEERASSAVTGLQNQLKAIIGEAKGIEGPQWKALWGLTKDSTGTNWEAIAKALALRIAQETGEPATHMIAALVEQNQIITKKGGRRFTFAFTSK